MKKSKPVLEQLFKIYHTESPEIYEMFKVYSFQLLATGKTMLSANLIFERIRWESSVSGNDGYKLNNSYRSYYSRLFMDDHPQFGSCFATRKLSD